MHRRDFLLTLSIGALLATADKGQALQSTAFRANKTWRTVNGHQMALVDKGTGPPVVFLHGNPTSSWLWRNILPAAHGTHRAIAPDLIGMGDSDQPALDYTYDDHASHLHGLLDALDLDDVTLVMHDWGSALGFDWAMQNESRVRSLVFMEAMVPPVVPYPAYSALGPFEALFRNLRSVGPGEQMVLQQNFFVEEILGKLGVITPLSEDVLEVYRAPFSTPESRLPTLQWPREVPIGGAPSTTHDVVTRYSDWLQQTELPKLLMYATPGALIPPDAAEWLRQNLRNLSAVDVGAGVHFLQEDQPDAIRRALENWLTTV